MSEAASTASGTGQESGGSGEAQEANQNGTGGSAAGESGTGQESGGTDSTINVDDLPAPVQKMIRDARSEAASHRTKLREFEAEAEKRREAEMSELEKAQEKNAKLEQALEERDRTARQERIASAAVKEAATLGYLVPAVAGAYVDANRVEFDDDGNPTNVDKLLKDHLQAHPQLGGTRRGGSDAAAAGSGSGDESDMNDLIRAATRGG